MLQLTWLIHAESRRCVHDEGCTLLKLQQAINGVNIGVLQLHFLSEVL